MSDGISTHADDIIECAIFCNTGVPEDVKFCLALPYLNMIMNRDHDFEFWIHSQYNNRAVVVIDKVLGTIEVTMPMY